MSRRVDSIPKGFSSRALGVIVAVETVTVFSVGINTEIYQISAWNANTDTVWMGFTNTVTSGTGYPLFSGTAVNLNYRGSNLYFHSGGGSSVVSYIALGK